MDSNHLHQLVARLLKHNDENKPEPYNYTAGNGYLCPMPRPLLETKMAPVVGGTTFYWLNLYITAGCAAFTSLVIFSLMARHATHLSRPNEQLNILRICCYLPIFAIGLFLEAAFPDAYVYIHPWLDFFQAIALANFFLLMCQYVSPSDEQRDAFFAVFEAPAKKTSKLFGRNRRNKDQTNGGGKEPKNGLEWYRGLWWCIFQYPIVQLLSAIFIDITEAARVYCLASSSPHFAHLWIDIAHNISLTVAVLAVLRMYGALKKQLAHHRPLAKLLAFKLLVGITFLIQLVYWILRSSIVDNNPLQPTDKLSWADAYIGIPVLILSVLCIPFSIFFHHAYSVTPYYLERASQHKPLAAYDVEMLAPGHADVNPVGSRYQGGPLGIWAWAGIFNPSEFIAGLKFGLQMRSNSRRRQGIYEENAPLTALPAGYHSRQSSPQPGQQAYVR
ncbi:organic solute transporter Ostalpha-domain-containing protein [Apiospora arundinis]|uniref:Organic solute transporter Ostalpha-domain-containing protein n=1 Tax=Apiospora arundinis TaxID=335852 RepID=A0ABR2JBF6_9PEZI